MVVTPPQVLVHPVQRCSTAVCRAADRQRVPHASKDCLPSDAAPHSPIHWAGHWPRSKYVGHTPSTPPTSPHPLPPLPPRWLPYRSPCQERSRRECLPGGLPDGAGGGLAEAAPCQRWRPSLGSEALPLAGSDHGGIHRREGRAVSPDQTVSGRGGSAKLPVCVTGPLCCPLQGLPPQGYAVPAPLPAS